MKKALLLMAFLSLIAVVVIAYNPAALRVQFAQTDWDSAKRNAVKDGKLFYVDFDASYCATCRNMDESTYMDQNLSNYINENVVAHRVNVQDFDGVMWSQTYEVEALPTMLVFDSKGKLVQRLVGYKSANDLLRVFNEVKAKELASAPIATNVGMQNETPMANTGGVKTEPAPVNNTVISNTTTKPTTTTTTLNPSVFPGGTTLANDAPVGLGLFEIAARKQDSKGFSVQVGVFNSYENVLTKATELREQFSDYRTILHAEKQGGQIVYKLLLGVFNSRRDATLFSTSLKQKKIEGLVKDLGLML